MPNAIDKDGYWLSMPGPRRGSIGIVRVLDSGDIEIERFDDSKVGASQGGYCLSTIYTVNQSNLLRLAEQIAIGFGGPAPELADLPDNLTTFLDVQCLINWLVRDSEVPFDMRSNLELLKKATGDDTAD